MLQLLTPDIYRLEGTLHICQSYMTRNSLAGRNSAGAVLVNREAHRERDHFFLSHLSHFTTTPPLVDAECLRMPWSKYIVFIDTLFMAVKLWCIKWQLHIGWEISHCHFKWTSFYSFSSEDLPWEHSMKRWLLFLYPINGMSVESALWAVLKRGIYQSHLRVFLN